MFMTMRRWGFVLVGLMAIGGTASARPQAAEKPPQNDSAAAAARKAREQKKAETKTARVWDNDNISMPAGGIEVVGPDANAPATDANAAAATGDQTAGGGPAQDARGATGLSPAEVAHTQAAIKKAQEKIAELKQQADLAQRKYNLDAAMFYGKPDFAADKDGQKAINQEKGSLEDIKQQLQLTQQMLAELRAKIGAPAEKAPEPKPAEPKPLQIKPAGGMQ